MAGPRGPSFWSRRTRYAQGTRCTTIDRRFEDILAVTQLRVMSDERASIGLDHRVIVLAKDT